MKTVSEISALRAEIGAARKEGKTVGVVPTMGAFHEGHLELMRRAKAENDIVIVTLFVNPTQFNDAEDFEKYPRTIEVDARLAEETGVDVLFTTTPTKMYAPGFDTVVVVREHTKHQKNKTKPNHNNNKTTNNTKHHNIAQ